MLYLIVKWTHIIGATLLFGTGLGTAFHFYAAYRRGDPKGVAISAENTVLADWLFTATSGFVQPLTGAILIILAGWDPLSAWLVWTYALYVLALLCWLPVVRLQLRMRELAMSAAQSGQPLPDAYHRCMRWWFVLGWPAFTALLIVFWLMVAKPSA